MIPAPESQKQIRISIAAVVWMVAMGFWVGTTWTRVSDLDKYVDAEVSGLRSDWERDRKTQNERIKLLEERLRELELNAR